MAEAVVAHGVVSSIVQLIDFATKLLGRLREFGLDLKDITKSFASIRSRVPLLVDTLSRTKAQSQSQALGAATAEALQAAVRHCLSQIDTLLNRCCPLKIPQNGNADGKP